MFKRNASKSAAISTLIGANTSVQGDLQFAGGCHVDGRVVGNVTTTAPDAGFLSVSERGSVEGEIFHRGAVQALAPDETQVAPRLAALVRKELIRPNATQLAAIAKTANHRNANIVIFRIFIFFLFCIFLN